jgi:hypothetical protein
MMKWDVAAKVAEFLKSRPDIVDVVSDTGGAGLCIDYSEELIRWVADNVPESGVVPGDADGGLIPEINTHTRLGDVPVPRCYPYSETWADGVHNVAWFPDETWEEGVCVDLTARQYDETLPFPHIWPSIPPTWIRESNRNRTKAV